MFGEFSVRGKAIDGFGTFGTAESLGDEYISSNNGNELDAVNSLIRWQNTKAATSGFLTNLGGLVTLPIAIPTNMASLLYVQLRMIAAIVHIGGHDIKDDRVKTLCYVCLVGNSAAEIIKSFGIQFGQKFTAAAIQKYITGEAIRSINKAVGFRLITKAGSTGILNLTKMVPLVGGIIGGTIDGISTNTVGNTARDTFIADSDGPSIGNDLKPNNLYDGEKTDSVDGSEMVAQNLRINKNRDDSQGEHMVVEHKAQNQQDIQGDVVDGQKPNDAAAQDVNTSIAQR